MPFFPADFAELDDKLRVRTVSPARFASSPTLSSITATSAEAAYTLTLRQGQAKITSTTCLPQAAGECRR
jgi:hypothetical protein